VEEVPRKAVIPVGEHWLLKAFWTDAQLTARLEPSPDGGQLVVSELSFTPLERPADWFAEIDLDSMVADAIWQIGELESQPEMQATMWTHRTRRGQPMSDSLLREVVDLRRHHSAAEIAQRLGRSRSQVFRYLQLARERGITGPTEGDADGAR